VKKQSAAPRRKAWTACAGACLYRVVVRILVVSPALDLSTAPLVGPRMEVLAMESEFRIVPGADRPLVVLSGVLDSRNACHAQKAIRRASAPVAAPIGCQRRARCCVSVDVGGLASFDRMGLRALVCEALKAHRAGRPLSLRDAGRPLLERLDRDGYLHLFGVETRVEAPRPAADVSVRIVCKEERLQTPADLAFLPQIRHRVVRFCKTLGAAGELLDSIHLATGEAATNAIRHGCRDDPSLSVESRCAAADDVLVIEVRDPGPGFDPASVHSPDPEELRPGGMGIHLMRAMMDEVRFSFGSEGTVARMVKQLPAVIRARLCPGREGPEDGRIEPAFDD
jgi:serine/threonine-protein kinase RsbW